MKKIGLLALSFGLIVSLPGCFQKPRRISSVAHTDTTVIPGGFPQRSTFAFAREDSAPVSLQTKELEKKIALSLEKNGYAVVPSASKADYVIALNYGSTSETRTVTVEKYIPGKTVSTIGSLLSTQGPNELYREDTVASGTYTYHPEEQIFYNKFLNIYVYDATQYNKLGKKRASHVWEGSAWNSDASSNLKSYLDFFVVRLMQFFGKDANQKTVDKYNNDRDVVWLRCAYDPNCKSKK